LFASTADGGFNCAGCHGGMNGVGGVAPFNVTDPTTGEVSNVNWLAPAVNSVFYRYDESEVRFILVYGRPFSPMSPWGLDGGGPLNDQQIDTLIAYMQSIQIPREGCGPGEEDDPNCPTGHLPAEVQADIDAAAMAAVEAGTYASYGEALYNLDLASGAYSCARCHTQGWSYGQPGVPGQGAFGWNLTGGSVNAHFPNEGDLLDFIRNGSELGARYGLQGQGSGRMPGFGSTLTDEQLEAIVEYIRSL
jgi:mono/diheme cytochrome c family protein